MKKVEKKKKERSTQLKHFIIYFFGKTTNLAFDFVAEVSLSSSPFDRKKKKDKKIKKERKEI